MLEKIKKYIPRSFKKLLRYSFLGLLDGFDFILGKRDSVIPPKRLIFIGDGEFRKVGEEFFRHFVELGGLKKSDNVLDVGKGIGRMAIPLINYLDPNSRYEGIDIVESGINWCKKNITSKHPNFNFQLADIYNKAYNPKGRFKAGEYKFPFEDGSFDFVFLTSVFTHMLPKDLENYLMQISRVLTNGGKYLITFFLVNDESKKLIDNGLSTRNLQYKLDGFYSTDKKYPELATGYDELYVFDLYKKCGLIVNKTLYGSWCGRKQYLSYQDIIIASKN